MPEIIYSKQSRVNDSTEALFSWHERPGALERLTPPWMGLKSVSTTRGIKPGSRVKVKLSLLGLPVTMEAEHMAYEPSSMFRDRLVRSPFAQWTHTHTFTPRGNNGSTLGDRVAYKLPPYLLGPLKPFVAQQIERMFAYRHSITCEDIHRHRDTLAPLTVLVSGAGGVVGSALVPFLTTGGHRVIRLVRRPPRADRDEVFWDPAPGTLDLTGVGPIDAVINLNGSRIFGNRWTRKQKAAIIQSRVDSTSTLARALAGLAHPPKVFISASATGFYGEGGSRVLTEDAPPGELFVSKVCSQWEAAAAPAREAGIRTVLARIGVALTPRGGALAELLPFFLLGLGGKVAKGDQYMGWIAMDDLVYGLHHIINTPGIHGPVNLVSPNPVTNHTFTRALARVLTTRAGLMLPEGAIRLLWGAMGEEVLLASTRAVPEKLLESGFRFSHPDLVDTLGFTLGRSVAGLLGKDHLHV